MPNQSPLALELDPVSPGSKKKKPALPTFLSSLRNAQAVIGRAADDFHERETRPLVVGGSGGGGNSRVAASPSHPQLHRTPPSTSFSSTLSRFGSQLRKHSHNTGKRRKKGHGVTGVPQSFYVAVGCFFFAFPLLFVTYIVARHAVFGDETENYVGKVHIHEVPSAFAIGSGVEIEGEGGTREHQHPVEGVANSEIFEETVPPASAESTINNLQNEVKHAPGELNLNQTTRDILDKSGPIVIPVIDRNGSENIHNETGEGGENILALKVINSSNDFKGNTETLEQTAKVQDSSLFSTSMMKEDILSPVYSPNKMGESEELHQDTLRGSQEEDEVT